MEFGFSMRGQYPAGVDMRESFANACELARVADKLGYSYITKGQHYAMGPVQAFQQVPYLSRIMAEAPNVARTHEEAMAFARPHMEGKYKSYHEEGQDKSMAKGDDNLNLSFDELVQNRFLVGSVDEVAEKLVDYSQRLGINVIIPAFQWIGTPHASVLECLHLFAEEVMPRVRKAL